MDNDSTEQLYTKYRPLLFAIAYRMLGSVADAEDIVQEVFLDWGERPRTGVTDEKAYLCRMVTNKCTDRLRSAAKQRELYVGPWLPEPLLTDEKDAESPAGSYLHKESLSTAYLLLLQQLSEVERVVFILREALQYDYEEIAQIVNKSSANCRQIFRRARLSLGGPRSEDEGFPISAPPAEAVSTVVESFVQALLTGNAARMLQLLKTDAMLYSDGGGKVKAAIRPIFGAERVSAFISGVTAKQPADTSVRLLSVNGRTGIVLYGDDRRPYAVTTFHIEDGRIAACYLQVNPDKLTRFPAL